VHPNLGRVLSWEGRTITPTPSRRLFHVCVSQLAHSDTVCRLHVAPVSGRPKPRRRSARRIESRPVTTKTVRASRPDARNEAVGPGTAKEHHDCQGKPTRPVLLRRDKNNAFGTRRCSACWSEHSPRTIGDRYQRFRKIRYATEAPLRRAVCWRGRTVAPALPMCEGLSQGHDR